MAQAAEKVRLAPRGVGKYLLQTAIVFAVQFAAGKLGEALPIVNSGGIGPVWPASGIALAAPLLLGYQVWPGVAAGAFLLALSSSIPREAAAVYAAGTTLAALTGTLLLRGVVNFHPSLSRLRDALGLIVFGAFGSSIVSASIGVSVLYAAHVRGWSGFGRAWLIYWLGDSMGVLLVTPLVLTLPNLLRIRSRVRIAELGALLLLLTAVCFIIFGDLAPVPVKLDVLAFAVLPFVIWAAIRFGVSGATLSTLFIASIATAETTLGSGPFDQNTPIINAAMLDVFFAVLAVSGMTLAAVIAEREQAEREREQLVREQAAMEVRLRLATIVESSDDAIIGEDMDGIVTDWNKGAERLYGYSANEVIGKPISLLVPPDRAGHFAEIMEALRRGNPVNHYETVRQKKDGTRIEVSLTASPIIGAEGRIVGASAIDRDITERKRTEEALRQSEERFRLAAQAGKMYAYEWNVATDRVMRSEEHVNVLGFSDQGKQLTRQRLLARIHPDDRALFVGSVDQLTPENPTTQASYRVLRPDGSVVWLEKSGRAFFDEQGRMLHMIGMVADVTERKQAEEALRQSEDKLRLLLDSTAEAIYGIDLEGRCTFCNPACLRTLGYDRADELLGKNMHDLIHHTRPDGTSIAVEECRILRAFRAGEGVHVDDEVLWRRNGTSFPAEYWAYPQRKKQEVVGAVVAFIDITEHKLAEAALASVSRRLIEAQEQERTRIARELHDDIVQRLALLTIALEQLPQNCRDLPAEVRSRLGELRKQTSEIATDIQSLSHELHSSKLEYLGIVAAMRGFCQEFGEQQKVEIDFKTHDLPPSSLAPEISLCLFRVLQEALRNSAKHSGVRHFEVELWGTSDEVHLTVKDSGSGFDREAAKESRGLGLVSMQERLKLLNGELSIESQPQRGTTIHARVPLRSEQSYERAAG